MKIDVNVTGLDFLAEAINKLAATVAHKPSKTIKESKKAKTESVTQAEAPTDKQAEDAVTMETVRAKLAALMQGGKQAEVKELLKKHGGDKLSDVPKENYPALLTEAEEM
jgi:hypothetical protein